MRNSIFALITAAGKSSRMGGIKKELIRINNYPLIYHTALPFFKSGLFKAVFVACRSDDEPLFREILNYPAEKYYTPVYFASGGETRQASVFSGLKAMSRLNPDIVLIHDGARPFVSEKTIKDVIKGALDFGACAPVIPVVDSLKTVDNDFFIQNHPDRTVYRAIQTPQGFVYKSIFESHIKASADNKSYTDDTEIYSLYSGRVFTVSGSADNIKITYPEDIKSRKTTEKADSFRIGQGYDIHRLTEDRALVIGGVTIPYDKGSDAHSDGDVLVHALCDALLGAVKLGDIGSNFPDTSDEFKDIDSKKLLARTCQLVRSKGYEIVNADSTIIAQKPKLRPYIALMEETLAGVMKVSPDNVSVKATTSEQLGPEGREEGISAHAVVLLVRNQVKTDW